MDGEEAIAVGRVGEEVKSVVRGPSIGVSQ
jgi:hypothetical protein